MASDHQTNKSNLDLIKEVDAFPWEDFDPDGHMQVMGDFFTLIWRDDQGDVPLGYVPVYVVDELVQTPVDIRGLIELDAKKRTLRAFFTQPTERERTMQISTLTKYWRINHTFKILAKWRDELWPVYGRHGELLYSLERSAVGLLGAMRYGVHMTAYVRDSQAPHGLRIWVAKRAADKASFPSRLDNTVAGGLMTGEDPFECIVREADEEASLPESVMRAGAKHVGQVSYLYITSEEAGGEAGLIYPECQWVYDLELPGDVVPRPKDGEVEAFALCDLAQARADLAAGRFKPNCALVLIDFLIRHGILTRSDELDLDEIDRRIHRVLPFPGPHERNVFSTSLGS